MSPKQFAPIREIRVSPNPTVSMKIRTLIVDDEPLARERLSGTEAIAAIRRDSPDLVFLDMQMPGCNGLQVLAEFPDDERPAIIFATAHERFALDAFDVAAVDYLLKPFDRERCAQALRRAQAIIHSRSAAVPAPAPEAKSDRFTVKADGRLVFLKAEEIVRVEAADNYVMLHLTTGRLMLRETMTAIESRLGTQGFARINRSAIVNLDQIREIQPAMHGDYTVVLRDGMKLPLSRSLRGQLDKFAGG
jgi:two-component system LytT family response regulator